VAEGFGIGAIDGLAHGKRLSLFRHANVSSSGTSKSKPILTARTAYEDLRKNKRDSAATRAAFLA
jgi:hypothetical protein